MNQSVEQQHVTLMSVEVHGIGHLLSSESRSYIIMAFDVCDAVNTRAELLPNPALDPITAIFYCIRDDNPEDDSYAIHPVFQLRS